MCAGAAVIDVGMNNVTDQSEFERLFVGNAKREESFRTKGSTLVGDVHPNARKSQARSRQSPEEWGPDHRHANGKYSQGREDAQGIADARPGRGARLTC